MSVFTVSTNFPTSAGAYDTTMSGSNEGAVFKLSANGSSLAYSTYLGASNTNDYLYGIAVDSSGQAVIAGATDGNNYPTTAGAYDTSFGGTFDAVVTKLNATGTGLVWSTFLGGTGSDTATAVAIGPNGNVFVTGQAASGFPTTAGAYDTTHNGGFDVWAGVLSSTGNALNYSTVPRLVGSETGRRHRRHRHQRLPRRRHASVERLPHHRRRLRHHLRAQRRRLRRETRPKPDRRRPTRLLDLPRRRRTRPRPGLAVDSTGRAHVAFYTQSTGLATAGAHDTTLGGSSDAAVRRAVGNQIDHGEYASYLGGSGNGSPRRLIALTATGAAWLVGGTSSNDMFVTANAYETSLSGTSDGLLRAVRTRTASS